MSDPSTLPALNPTPAGERIQALDALRGLALLGIALVNVEFFTRPLQDINGPGIDPGARGSDRAVEWLTYFFLQGKFWTLFALLFGVGFGLMIDRARPAGTFVAAYLRRSLALLAIGVVHALLVWSGDILISYAIAALLLLALRQWRRWFHRDRPAAPMSAVRLTAWGAVLYVLPLALILSVGALQSLPGFAPTAGARAALEKTAAEQASLRARAEIAYSQGSYGEAMIQRIEDTAWQLSTLPLGMFWILALFLMGAAILRSGVFADVFAHQPTLRRMRNIGLPLGFAAMALSTGLGTATPSGVITFADALQMTFSSAASLMLALAYAATLLLALCSRGGRWLESWLAPAGRMALSNYLLQSIVGTLLFYGYGLALWGEVARTWQVVGVLVAFAAQAIVSRWWLRRFRHGPAEWVWRCMTYRRLVPFRVG